MVTTTDQKAMFKKHMEDIGVSPKAIIPTIAEVFFSGDINELSWLDHVLTKDAAGFVTPPQRQFMIAWWDKTRGLLPYSEELQVEYRFITLAELGAYIGIPIKVRPWWGSVRQRASATHRGCGRLVWRDVFTGNRSYYCPSCNRRLDPKDVEVEQVFRRRFLCPGGAYSQIKWPEVQKGMVVIWEGPCLAKWGGRTHAHRQDIEVLNVDGQAMLVCISVSKNTSHFLIGMDDGHPFVTPVNKKPRTVLEAFDWLMPNKVREAIAAGLDVKRQGDWHFIPTTKEPRIHKFGDRLYYANLVGMRNPAGLKVNALHYGAPLIYGTETRHKGSQVVYQSFQNLAHPAPLVRGSVEAPDHTTLHLSSWHIGVRNRRTNAGTDGRPGLD